MINEANADAAKTLPSWPYKIPQEIAAYACGLFHASRALPPFQPITWHQVRRAMLSIGLTRGELIPIGELECAAVAWGTRHVEPAVWVWLTQRTPRKKRVRARRTSR